MKKSFILALTLLAGIIACEKPEKVIDEEEVSHNQVFSASPSTKAIISNVYDGQMVWSSYDNLAVYSFSGETALHSGQAVINPEDVDFVSAGFTSTDPTSTWFGAAENAVYYAYYPQTSAPIPSISAGKVALSIPSNQDGEFGKYQICWAASKEYSKAEAEEGVSFAFAPKTSVLRTRLTLAEACEVDEVNIVQLIITIPEVVAVGSCTLDMFNGNIAVGEGGSVITIDLDTPVTIYKIKDSNPTIDCALFPIASNGKTINFHVVTEDDEAVDISKVVDFDLGAGQCYDVNLDFDFEVDTTPHNYYYGSANSYVVMGGSVNVDVTRYEADADYFPVATEIFTSKEPKKAKIVWKEETITSMTVPATITGNSFEITDIAGTGNALVAIMDKRDNVLWSYHIWVPEIDPTAEANLLTYSNTSGSQGSYQVMCMPLGATNKYVYNAAEESAVAIRGKAKAIGLSYQWGRKDPMGKAQAPAYVAVDTPNAGDPALYAGRFTSCVDADGNTYPFETKVISVASVLGAAAEDKDRLMIEYSIKNPDIFIHSGTGAIWTETKNDKLWGNAAGYTYPAGNTIKKSIYDPCPAGYMVAPKGIFNNFKTSGAPKNASNASSFGADYGYNFYYEDELAGNTDFFVASGKVVLKDGKRFMRDAGKYIFYWSSSPDSDSSNSGSCLYGGSGSVGPTNTSSREDACPIRCVKVQ